MSGTLPLALRIYGSQAKVAAALGISTSAVAQWKRVPAKRVDRVAEVLGVSIGELRPDLVQPAAA